MMGDTYQKSPRSFWPCLHECGCVWEEVHTNEQIKVNSIWNIFIKISNKKQLPSRFEFKISSSQTTICVFTYLLTFFFSHFLFSQSLPVCHGLWCQNANTHNETTQTHTWAQRKTNGAWYSGVDVHTLKTTYVWVFSWLSSEVRVPSIP